ncbi:MAG: DUF1501 domain-containing protein [Planctomycetota bacterium]|nr:MAG: DUF1501 domain-containing protein [Planctomycetota bacterium]
MGPLGAAGFSRRDFLRLGAAAGLSFVAPPFAWAQGEPGEDLATSLIVLWLDGGPSQLETFDPKPGTRIGGPTRAIDTRVPGVRFCADLPRLAERADKLAVLRSVVTREGEHQRGRYLMRTGKPLLPTVAQPSVGAVLAHELPREGLEIPPHVALLANDPPRGGFLGAELNAFVVGDPKDPLPDLVSPAGEERFAARMEDLALLERGFARGRPGRAQDTQHHTLARRARSMMESEQVAAFDYRREPERTIEAYGDDPFGRACLVARRLVETGVPAVEVTLDGWDSHANNFEVHTELAERLDRAFAALLDDLIERELLRKTIVLCCGEFGRTPRINALEGRDHWTRGFSVVLAGGGLRSGVVVGETDPEGERPPADPVRVPDLYATLYARLGVDGSQWFDSDQGRPIQLNSGEPLRQLLPA